MTITLEQLEQLKKAIQENNTDALIKRWEDEETFRQMSKESNVSFELTNLQNKVTKTVIGKAVGDHFAFHKDAWGGTHWVLTHTNTGIKILSGKKLTVAKTIKEFMKWNCVDKLAFALNESGNKALQKLTNEETAEYREFYNQAQGYN